jgi:hypothetical protein
MHEDGEKKDDRKGDTDKPEKRAFAKTHVSLLIILHLRINVLGEFSFPSAR